MSRPAPSCSLITVRVAPWNASAGDAILNASSTSRPASCCVNHCGRGYEPTIVVGKRCMAAEILRLGRRRRNGWVTGQEAEPVDARGNAHREARAQERVHRSDVIRELALEQRADLHPAVLRERVQAL